MSPAAGIAMVLSGALCLGGAVAARRWIGIAAAALMLLAMTDLAFTRILPPIAWGAVLLTAGTALGAALRAGASAADPAADPAAGPGPGGRPRPRLGRAVAIAGALAYPCMAWLVVSHGAASDAGGSAAGHAGHGAGGLAPVPVVLACAAAAVLAVLAALALRRGRRALALESGGMAAMLFAMLLG